MTAKERILALRLLKKQERAEECMKGLGIKVVMTVQPNEKEKTEETK